MFRCRGNLTGKCVRKSEWGREDAKDSLGNDASCRDGSDKYRPIKQTVIKEENPNHQTTLNQTWKTKVGYKVYKNESDPFKVPPSETLPDFTLSSADYIKDETTNLMMAAPTEETCRDNEGFSCQGRLCDCVCYNDNEDDKAKR